MLGLGDRAGGMFRLIGQEGLRGATGLAVLVDAVEERGEGVVIGLGDGIELVGVALRAAQRHAQPGRAHGVHAIQHVIDPRFLGVAAAFAVGHVITLEAGRELLLGGRVRQEVAGELLERELVVRRIAIEGFDDPVAPGPVGPGGIRLEAVGVRIAGGVEPPHGHALTIVRRGQQAVDGLLIGRGRTVGEESRGLGFGRRQAGEVEGESAEQGVLGRWLGASQSLGREFLADKGVDGMSFGRGLHGSFESPVLAPHGAFGDPAAEEVYLGLGQPSLVRLGRRHEFVLVGGHDALDESADVGLARHERFLGQGGLADVEPELGLAVRLILAVAAETVV